MLFRAVRRSSLWPTQLAHADLKDELAALKIEREPVHVGVRPLDRLDRRDCAAARAGTRRLFLATREQPVEVQTATVTARAAGAQAAVLNASGYVTARRQATVSSKVTGKVVEVNVEEGMAVKEGKVLARLDDSQAQAALALARGAGECRRQVGQGKRSSPRAGEDHARSHAEARQDRLRARSRTSTRRRPTSTRRSRASRRSGSRPTSPIGRSTCRRPSSTTRSSARRSAAW